MKLLKYKKIIIDFIYCLIAYALPVIVIQFIIQPVIAAKVDEDINGLFITLYSIVKLLISVFVVPLANLRLLKKRDCLDKDNLDKFFNGLFILLTLICLFIGCILTFAYNRFHADFFDLLFISIFIFLICIHDFYAIEYRLILNYKKIIMDNVFIILGYALGLFIFYKTLIWEYIFIVGYLLGTVFVLSTTKIWRKGYNLKIDKLMLNEYLQLSMSSALNNSTVYCDKLIIYPVLGGYSVSVYNSSAVVSKAVTVITTPLRNVLLSYIVGNDKGQINRSIIKRGIYLILFGSILTFIVFYLLSAFMCKFLYPQYFDDAIIYIPIIIVGVIFETLATIFNVIVLRFGRLKNQVIISSVKLFVYLVSVFIFAICLNMELYGFCIAILTTAICHLVLVLINIRKCIEVI